MMFCYGRSPSSPTPKLAEQGKPAGESQTRRHSWSRDGSAPCASAVGLFAELSGLGRNQHSSTNPQEPCVRLWVCVQKAYRALDCELYMTKPSNTLQV